MFEASCTLHFTVTGFPARELEPAIGDENSGLGVGGV